MGILIGLYAFLFDIDKKEMMLLVATLVMFDLLTGVFAARKQNITIESRKLIKTPFKLAVYCLLVSTTHLTDVAMHIPNDWLNMETMMIGFLAATEGVSILENVGKMGYAVPQKILGVLIDYANTQEEPTFKDEGVIKP